jgi:hypothetical protein
MPIKNLIVSSIAAVVSVFVSIFTMRYIGMWAAIFSTFFAYFIIMWIRLVDIRKFINIKIDWSSFLLNQFVVIIHAVLITMDFCPLWVSAIVFLLFVIINIKFLKGFLQNFKGRKA